MSEEKGGMSATQFYTFLVLLTAACSVGIIFLHRIALFQGHVVLSWISIGFFVLLTAAMYHMGYRAALSTNKHAFTNTFMGFMMGKLFFSAILILGYYYTIKPESKLFILPFFGIYFLYTVYEVIFMSKLGKMNA